MGNLAFNAGGLTDQKPRRIFPSSPTVPMPGLPNPPGGSPALPIGNPVRPGGGFGGVGPGTYPGRRMFPSSGGSPLLPMPGGVPTAPPTPSPTPTPGLSAPPPVSPAPPTPLMGTPTPPVQDPSIYSYGGPTMTLLNGQGPGSAPGLPGSNLNSIIGTGAGGFPGGVTGGGGGGRAGYSDNLDPAAFGNSWGAANPWSPSQPKFPFTPGLM